MISKGKAIANHYKMGSLKYSSCVGERMRTSLNQLLNKFYRFKVNLFVHGAGWGSIQRNKWLLAVFSLSFGVGEINCSQGILSHNHQQMQDKTTKLLQTEDQNRESEYSQHRTCPVGR